MQLVTPPMSVYIRIYLITSTHEMNTMSYEERCIIRALSSGIHAKIFVSFFKAKNLSLPLWVFKIVNNLIFAETEVFSSLFLEVRVALWSAPRKCCTLWGGRHSVVPVLEWTPNCFYSCKFRKLVKLYQFT